MNNIKIYHEKQYLNYCRLHAINNLLGNKIFTLEQFNKLCDEFDKINNFPLEFSKKTFAFYNFGNINNIFGYVISKKLKINMDYLNKINFSKINFNKLIGFICFNNNHTWCVRYINNKFYLIDSLSNNIKEINFSYFYNKNIYTFYIAKL